MRIKLIALLFFCFTLHAEKPQNLTEEEWQCFDNKLLYTPQEKIEYHHIPTIDITDIEPLVTNFIPIDTTSFDNNPENNYQPQEVIPSHKHSPRHNVDLRTFMNEGHNSTKRSYRNRRNIYLTTQDQVLRNHGLQIAEYVYLADYSEEHRYQFFITRNIETLQKIHHAMVDFLRYFHTKKNRCFRKTVAWDDLGLFKTTGSKKNKSFAITQFADKIIQEISNSITYLQEQERNQHHNKLLSSCNKQIDIYNHQLKHNHIKHLERYKRRIDAAEAELNNPNSNLLQNHFYEEITNTLNQTKKIRGIFVDHEDINSLLDITKTSASEAFTYNKEKNYDSTASCIDFATSILILAKEIGLTLTTPTGIAYALSGAALGCSQRAIFPYLLAINTTISPFKTIKGFVLGVTGIFYNTIRSAWVALYDFDQFNKEISEQIESFKKMSDEDKAFAIGKSIATWLIPTSALKMPALEKVKGKVSKTCENLYKKVIKKHKTIVKNSNIDNVIKETLQGKENITSKYILSADEALTVGEIFLGKGYKEISGKKKGIFRSNGGTGNRIFRIDNGSLQGKHKPHVPHVHLEILKPDGKGRIVNNHIILKE